MFGQDQGNQKEWYDPGLRFKCTACGACCTGPPGYVLFSKEELADMAAYLGLSQDDFVTQYTRRFEHWLSLAEVKRKGKYDCIFLRWDEQGHGTCSIYPVRPTQCRTWPFWPENLKSERAWKRAAKSCPGMADGLNGGGDFVPIEKIRIQRDQTPTI